MKLSEAIRAGAKITLPGTYDLMFRTDVGWAACALGCAIIGGIGGKPTAVKARKGYDYLYDTWPELRTEVEHPVRRTQREVADVATSLNDYYGWPREQIADWLESLGY